MYVTAIDVGVRNLAICVYDLRTQQVCYWHVGSIVDGKYHPYQTVTLVKTWLDRHSKYFDNSVKVIVERQMRCNMRIIESLIQFATYSKCEVISARSVKAHYGLSMRNYRLNKQKAIQFVTDYMARHPGAFSPTCTETFRTSNKKDDYADSLLLCLFFLDTYSISAVCTNDATNPCLV